MNPMPPLSLALALALSPLAHPALAAGVPEAVTRLLPPGFEVLAAASARLDGGTRPDVVVVLRAKGEADLSIFAENAPARPLLVFRPVGTADYALAARNDTVVLKRNEGGQCDPFEYVGDGGLTLKGSRFTVENGVACGQHWTDYITFRFDPARGFVFDSEITENYVFNDDPQGDALKLGSHHVRRADPARPVPLGSWRPSP